MSQCKNFNFRKVKKLVKQHKFVIKRQKGSHITIFKPGHPNSEFTIVRNCKNSYSEGFIDDLKAHLKKFN
jgi:predicted RNA binding protein YcfA (HicA-like mRNA interferase family)